MPTPGHAHRLSLSATFLAVQIVFTGLHLVPQLVYRIVNPTTTRVIAYVNALGPVWAALFGLTSVALGLSLWKGRYAHLAHIACGGLWAMYSAALWIGALGDSPAGPVTWPVGSIAVIAVHMILAISYADSYDREKRGHR